jgi:hypothetical protein
MATPAVQGAVAAVLAAAVAAGEEAAEVGEAEAAPRISTPRLVRMGPRSAARSTWSVAMTARTTARSAASFKASASDELEARSRGHHAGRGRKGTMRWLRELQHDLPANSRWRCSSAAARAGPPKRSPTPNVGGRSADGSACATRPLVLGGAHQGVGRAPTSSAGTCRRRGTARRIGPRSMTTTRSTGCARARRRAL